MKKKLKNSNGITLIALIITIIILLILAGISISALTQTGLFSRAKQAEQLSKEKQEEENVTLGTYENEIGKYLGNNTNTSEELKLVDKVNDGTIKIGDYVKYIPDTVTNTDKKYTDLLSNLRTYSGNTDETRNTTSTITQEKNLNWRVLDVKDGQVRLISEEPVTSARIALQGYNGYNNAVKLLDDACNILYSNATLASKVQNLKIEDIQDKMIEKDYSKISSEYGIYGSTDSPTNKYYPSILSKEKGQIVNGKEGTELDLSEQKEFINQTTSLSVNSWTVKFTSWEKAMVKEDFSNEKYYEMFLNNKTRYYWISSRCALVSSSYAHFDVRFVNDGSVTAANLYHSGNGERSANTYLRPVITLNSNVQIDTANSGNGSTAELAYVIK